MTGDKIYVQGTNITCNSCFPVPIDRNKARVLASTTSSTKNVLHDAVAKSFWAQWLSNNTNCKECTQSDQDCGDDPHAAPVKCYIQERRWRGAPFPSPSNRHGQRWLKERSGIPFASRSYKLGQRSLVKRRSPSQRYDQGERWPVEIGVPSASPFLLLKQSGDPFPSPSYTGNQIRPAESGVVPSPSPSSDKHGKAGRLLAQIVSRGKAKIRTLPLPALIKVGMAHLPPRPLPAQAVSQGQATIRTTHPLPARLQVVMAPIPPCPLPAQVVSQGQATIRTTHPLPARLKVVMVPLPPRPLPPCPLPAQVFSLGKATIRSLPPPIFLEVLLPLLLLLLLPL